MLRTGRLSNRNTGGDLMSDQLPGIRARMLRIKPLAQILADAENPDHRLNRTLTLTDLIALGVGAIIGTGIFVLIGTAIVGDGATRRRAGHYPLLHALGLACVLAALCYGVA
jgi:APA family basic amino acid/polyamine antiporter